MILTNTDILAFTAIKGVGPATIGKGIEALAYPSQEAISLPPRIDDALSDKFEKERIYEYAYKQIEIAQSNDVEIISRVDPRYPALAARALDAPPVLFVKGNFAALQGRQIGVIGTREPTAHGEIAVQRLTDFFSQAGFAIVSGLALGCDTIAHQQCIGAGGSAVAVMAHGLQTVAPKRNAVLAEKIISTGGALVSEFAFGVEPQPRLFVQRDKTQSLLSEAIVMAQSDLKGGSLHASRAILQFGRKLLIPYPTSADRANAEPKIQANLVIADGTDMEKTDLLRCDKRSLTNIMVIRGREDYGRVMSFISSVNEPIQQTLI